MGNGSYHPEEQKKKERLGDLYETETPPEGARIIGEEENISTDELEKSSTEK